MRLRSSGSHAAFALAVFLAATLVHAQKIPAPTSQVAARADDVSLDVYQQHLVRLQSALSACAQARDAKTCDPDLIGHDDRVSIIVGSAVQKRVVRYGWLRVLFQKAASKGEFNEKGKSGSKAAASSEAVPSTTELLKDAKTRLEYDLTQSRAPLSAPARINRPPSRAKSTVRVPWPRVL